MKSIYHEGAELMKHLKNEDFFDVKKFPIATLKFESNPENNVSGELTIKDTKGQLTFAPEIKEEGRKMIVKGAAAIDRTIYGIKYNSSSFFQDLGSYAIKNIFDIEFELEYVLNE